MKAEPNTSLHSQQLCHIREAGRNVWVRAWVVEPTERPELGARGVCVDGESGGRSRHMLASAVQPYPAAKSTVDADDAAEPGRVARVGGIARLKSTRRVVRVMR